MRRAASAAQAGSLSQKGDCEAPNKAASTAAHLVLLGVGCALMLLALPPSESPPAPSVPQAAPAVGQPVSPAPLPVTREAPLLVTKERPLMPAMFTPADLVPAGGVQVAAAAAPDLLAMLDSARADGVLMTVVSGYRSHAEQAALFESYVHALGSEAAGEMSAQAGHSEHQTGLAIDIADSTGACSLRDCFAGTAAGIWSAANAWKFGFIVRYPAGANAVTGYTYEPWHLRHVGTSVSAAMHNQGIATLEEFLGLG